MMQKGTDTSLKSLDLQVIYFVEVVSISQTSPSKGTLSGDIMSLCQCVTAPCERPALTDHHVALTLTTGAVYTRARLDRERRAVFHVPVVATDGGGRAGHAVITVNVADQGDNRPQFKLREYKSNVYSNAPRNAFVLQVGRRVCRPHSLYLCYCTAVHTVW